MAAAEEKGVDRTLGTRMTNLFQLLEKGLFKGSKKQSTEDLQQIKYVTTKLQQIVTGQDKFHRDLVLKHTSNVDILVATLQNTADDQVMGNVVSIFIELIGKAQIGKRASLMVHHGVTNVLFQILKSAVHDQSLPDELLINIHVIFSRIGHKDRKFAVKARLNKVLQLTLSLIKSHTNSFRNLQHLMQVFKLYTNNSVNASYLGKHSSINIMFKVISLCGRKHTVVLKLALDNLNNLTKSKSNSARTIGMGCVPTVLSLYSDWHQTDSKHRHINLRKAILNILKNITNLKSGRKAFSEADGIRVLYETSKEVIECREMEGIILLASIIMRKCYPRNKLPLADVQSPISFPLPDSDFHIPECCLNDDQAFGNMRPPQEESDHSSMDDDDDIDSDDERFRTDNSDEPDDEQGESLEPVEQRSAEDLKMYDKFFPELFDFEFESFGDRGMPSVVIPTAASDPHFSVYAGRSCDLKPPETCRRVKSSSNIPETYGRNFQRTPPSSESDTVLRRRTIQGSDQDLSFARYGGFQGTDSATAVNVKTGASVFSLDLQVPSANKQVPKSAQSAQRSSKKIKTSKKSQSTKDKKKRTKVEPEFTEALCITPIPTPRDYLDDFDRPLSSSSDDVDEEDVVHDPRLHMRIASETKSAFRFEKLAYPDLYGAKATPLPENLYNRKFGVQRAKVFEDIDRMIHPDHVIDRVVYNVDTQVAGVAGQGNNNLSNRDELRIGRQDMTSSALRFNSLFESGNLRKAIQVRDNEYDLILNPDINTNHHHQWFYFEVSNMVADIPYRFNIVNCEKINSQFNSGMKPLMYSVTEALEGRSFWKRTGSEICYYKNHFIRSALTTGGVKGKSYYTATFTIKFKHSRDICYLAYHYPYTYSTLVTHLYQLESSYDMQQIYFHNQSLCESLAGNSVPVLTITAQPKALDRESIEEFRSRPYIFLSARVHPGESNASWIMKGTIDFLMSKNRVAQQAREKFIFKIIPMLNPDGVINGNHRCSLVAEDLNRRWLHPCPKLHPTIYHCKGLLQYLNMVNKTPLVYCDYHGHSRRKNIFLYGCSPSLSWIPNDAQNPASTGNRSEDTGFKALPRILHSACSSFSIQTCSFVVERAKEATARVVVWRQIGIVRSYTMESSYCGCDQGKYKDLHMNTRMLEEMGHKFCESLIKVAKSSSLCEQMPNLEHSISGSYHGASSAEIGDAGAYDLDDDDMKREASSLIDFDANDESDEEAFQDEDEDNYFDDDDRL